MPKFLTAFIFLIFLAACSNKSDKDKAPNTDNVTIKKAPEIIAPLLLDKAKLSLTPISQEEFKAIPYQDAVFRLSKQLCEQSKGYNANQWEGLNECSWAVEKEKINANKDLVSRKGEMLVLKTADSEISFKNSPEANTGATYYRFKDYFPKTNYYLIEEMISGQCLNSKLINRLDGSQFPFKGTLTASSDGQHFIVYYLSATDTTKCPSKLEYYEIVVEGILKKWHIPLQNHSIHELKLVADNEFYLSLLIDGEPGIGNEYVKITLLDALDQ